MAKLTWNEAGSRVYEVGVDRGVLYVGSNPGVAWNGLTVISEEPAGAESEKFYLDGIVYQTVQTREEFSGSIEAFYSPAEFDACDGILSLAPGLFVKEQARQPFGLSYRTKIGNDLDGQDYGYKIHILYNIQAAPSSRTYSTINDSPDVEPLVWDITSIPQTFSNSITSSHVIINSVDTNPVVLGLIEDVLYGTSTTQPQLPTLDELLALQNYESLLTVVDNGDGTFTVENPGSAIQMLSSTVFQITHNNAVFIDSDTYTLSSS